MRNKTSTNSNVPTELFEVSKRNRSIYGRIYKFAKNVFYVIAIIAIILYLIMNHKMQVQIRELQQGILKPSAHYVYGISNFNLHISLAHALKRRETLVCNAWKRNKKNTVTQKIFREITLHYDLLISRNFCEIIVT